jgi:tRNA isopentenyl-2-thiomethyl-A-37 hydroxylase MiaE
MWRSNRDSRQASLIDRFVITNKTKLRAWYNHKTWMKPWNLYLLHIKASIYATHDKARISLTQDEYT